jgi:hypothetical protein
MSLLFSTLRLSLGWGLWWLRSRTTLWLISTARLWLITIARNGLMSLRQAS